MIVGQFAESDADKDMAQKLLDILYATEDGFAIPEEENGMQAPPKEFWAIFSNQALFIGCQFKAVMH